MSRAIFSRRPATHCKILRLDDGRRHEGRLLGTLDRQVYEVRVEQDGPAALRALVVRQFGPYLP